MSDDEEKFDDNDAKNGYVNTGGATDFEKDVDTLDAADEERYEIEEEDEEDDTDLSFIPREKGLRYELSPRDNPRAETDKHNKRAVDTYMRKNGQHICSLVSLIEIELLLHKPDNVVAFINKNIFTLPENELKQRIGYLEK